TPGQEVAPCACESLPEVPACFRAGCAAVFPLRPPVPNAVHRADGRAYPVVRRAAALRSTRIWAAVPAGPATPATSEGNTGRRLDCHWVYRVAVPAHPPHIRPWHPRQDSGVTYRAAANHGNEQVRRERSRTGRPPGGC